MRKIKIRNIKKSKGWCWQEKTVMKLIRQKYHGKRRTTAIAVYQTLSELASNHGTDVFPAYNRQIAELAGKSVSTTKRYCKDFIEIGILVKRLRKKNKRINLANEWSLLTPSAHNNDPTFIQDRDIKLAQDKKPHIKENKPEKNYYLNKGIEILREKMEELGLKRSK